MIHNEHVHADGSRAITTNNGDGTGTRTTYAADGSVVGVEALTGLPNPEPVTPSPAEMFDALDPTLAKAILDAAGGIVQRAGEIWDFTFAMPAEDPAKEPLRVVAEIALTAALPLVEPE